MNDCFGREIKPGDVVAYSSNCNGACLGVAQVIGPCKAPSDRIRVRVFQSNSYRFRQGKKNWRTGEVITPPGTPYVTTIGMPNRVVIIDSTGTWRVP